MSIVDGVEIHHKDVVFGVGLLHLGGDIRLAHFAFDSLRELLIGEDGVADELLRNRGSAFVTATERDNCCARNAHQIDAAVLVKTFVLYVDGAFNLIF